MPNSSTSFERFCTVIHFCCQGMQFDFLPYNPGSGFRQYSCTWSVSLMHLMSTFLLLFQTVSLCKKITRMILESLKTKNDIAIQRIQTSITDSYEVISIFFVYWESDNTGSREYSDLFILLQLLTVKPYMKALSDKDWVVPLINEVTNHPQSQPNYPPLCRPCKSW